MVNNFWILAHWRPIYSMASFIVFSVTVWKCDVTLYSVASRQPEEREDRRQELFCGAIDVKGERKWI